MNAILQLLIVLVPSVIVLYIIARLLVEAVFKLTKWLRKRD